MGLKVLVADDALFMRTILKKILTRAGYEIIGEATNGLEAVEKFKALKPDVVTLDIVMPIKDGISALKDIMQLDGTATVFMISAMGQEMLKTEASDNGARGFIEKPFKEEDVLAALSLAGKDISAKVDQAPEALANS